jgi:hypothetical protein
VALGLLLNDDRARIARVEAGPTPRLVELSAVDLADGLVVDGRVERPDDLAGVLRPALRGEVVVAALAAPEVRLVPATLAQSTERLRQTLVDDPIAALGLLTGVWCRDQGVGDASCLAMAADRSVESLGRMLATAEVRACAVDALPLTLLRVGAFRREFLSATTLVEWFDGRMAWWATTTDGWPTAGGSIAPSGEQTGPGLWVVRHGLKHRLVDLSMVVGFDGSSESFTYVPAIAAALAAVDDRVFAIDLRRPAWTLDPASLAT